ncbi:hypothetical protein [Clostridium sp.]|uniref:hypothetical protein n=1 Tax=Clostridium sp. TaxID=1506 RepID=UPI003D6CFF8E
MIGLIYNIIKADKNDAKSDRFNIKAFEKNVNAEENKNNQRHETDMSLIKLANRKKGILSTSMNDFIKVYEKIMTINFLESEGIKELGISVLSPTIFKEMRDMTGVAGIQMTSGQTIVTYLLSGISGIIAKESEMNLNTASMRNKQANVIASQSETICMALDAVKERANRISEVLAKINILFRKSIETTDNLISEKGRDRKKYTNQDKEQIMTCMNVATTIKKIIDTKLFDEDGEITLQSVEAVQIGEKYLQKINNAIG